MPFMKSKNLLLRPLFALLFSGLIAPTAPLSALAGDQAEAGLPSLLRRVPDDLQSDGQEGKVRSFQWMLHKVDRRPVVVAYATRII